MTSFFEAASNMTFSGSQSFVSANTVTNNYHYPASGYGDSSSRNDGQWLALPSGTHRLRVIDMCDVNMLEQVSSRTVHVSIQSRPLKPTNPFRSRLENQKGSVKIRKRVQSAEIVQFGDRRFTVVTYEPDSEADAANIRKVLQPLYEAAVSSRQVSLTQIFGVSRSTVTALIYHDELVDGDDILAHHFSYKTPIVYHYLWCRYNPAYWAAVESLENSSISVMDRSYWMFNLRTHSFQYDIPSRALSYAVEAKADRFSKGFFDDTLFPHVSTSCNPMLNSRGIVSAFPDFIDWVSAVGGTAYTRFITDFVCHDVLTFGTIVDRAKSGICGYLPSIPCPVFYCDNSFDSNVNVKFSDSVPSLLHLSFTKKTDIRIKIHFILQIPPEVRRLYRNAYLVQSLALARDAAADIHGLVFVDEVRFVLVGTFTPHPTKSYPPTYLHAHHLSSEQMNGMHCLRWPPTDQFFYWSLDPDGLTKIAERDWELYGIPKLQLFTCIGSTWVGESYWAVWDYFQIQQVRDKLDIEQFAIRHGYPLLVEGDPHVPAKDCPTTDILDVAIPDRPKSRIRRAVSWVGKKVLKRKGSAESKVKGKGKARELNSQAGNSIIQVVGQASIVEISESDLE